MLLQWLLGQRVDTMIDLGEILDVGSGDVVQDHGQKLVR